jgi:AraC-like DNA-binding protein
MLDIILSSIGGSAGLFCAAALLVRDRTRSPETVYLAIAVALLGLNMVDDALTAARVYAAAPAFFGWSYVAYAWVGPLVWLHVSAAADPVEAGWPRARPHVWGALALIALLLPWLLSGSDVRWQVETGRAALTAPAVAASLSVLAYLLATAVQMGAYLFAARRRAQAIVAPGKRRWSRLLTSTTLAAWALYLVALGWSFFGATSTVAVVNAALTLSIYGLAIVAISTPPDPLTAPSARNAERAKYARSALTPEDIARLMGKLDSAVRDRQVHLDPALTLARLAAVVQASPNDLSQALNVAADGFHAWLARMRIEEALGRMRAGEDDAGLLDLALAVGFNSKSTFYDAFRRVTGQTPAAWRASLTAGAAPP